ncbi:MAG: carbamoyltransferase HypF [Xanthomonadales bacterium]
MAAQHGRSRIRGVTARRFVVTGRVQGVGYRPFVYNRALELGLSGTVQNGAGRVFVHAEGDAAALDRLAYDLVHAAPPLARPELAANEVVETEGLAGFSILASDAATEAEIHVPPDLFTCDDCLAELTDPAERRFGYPFINCTQCGPRYTIIAAMPYDRPNTSMAGFPLCDACRAEYESPADRRFHAQPLACAECGPRLEFVTDARPVSVARGTAEAGGTDGKGSRPPDPEAFLNTPSNAALRDAIDAIEAGRILAIKGIGGYHLVCDASDDAAVRRLRARKHRPHKPLQRAAFSLSPSLAPGLRELGAFLPYSPLHHELLAQLQRPIVATSGNISGEPVITDRQEAQDRLAGIADAFLHHDRPIVRPADDPVIRPMAGRARAIRLGRGTAPLERRLPRPLAHPVLATGGHMKNTVALAWGDRVVVSPHVGDLDSARSCEIFELTISSLQALYDVTTETIACDLHPGYASTRWAGRQGLPVQRIAHHVAHASALAGEHPDVDDWLVFAWDGVGFGPDGTLWGGEALQGRPGRWTRVASFRPFRLVGGDRAGREPWRSAAALVWAERQAGAEVLIPRFGLTGDEAELAHAAWSRGLNTFETSAVGRLFDAAAALVLGRNVASFEGQGPMELEQAAAAGGEAIDLPLTRDEGGVWRSDWGPLLAFLCDAGIPPAMRASGFHETMAAALVAQARRIHAQRPFQAVGLSGGVFQNRRLTERVCERLADAGIAVRLHQDLPANDGGLCFGQVIEAAALQEASPAKPRPNA